MKKRFAGITDTRKSRYLAALLDACGSGQSIQSTDDRLGALEQAH